MEVARIRGDGGQVGACARCSGLGQLLGPRTADALDVPVPVEQVVDRLEEEAHVVAEAQPGLALRLGNRRDLEPDSNGSEEEPPRLQTVKLLEIAGVLPDRLRSLWPGVDV